MLRYLIVRPGLDMHGVVRPYLEGTIDRLGADPEPHDVRVDQRSMGRFDTTYGQVGSLAPFRGLRHDLWSASVLLL